MNEGWVKTKGRRVGEMVGQHDAAALMSRWETSPLAVMMVIDGNRGGGGVVACPRLSYYRSRYIQQRLTPLTLSIVMAG